MAQVTSRLHIDRGNLLRYGSIAEAVQHRAEQVQCLLLTRRKIALAYKRTHEEHDRLALERIDNELTTYKIDIPAVQRSAGRGRR
jgi:hypothetical protein